MQNNELNLQLIQYRNVLKNLAFKFTTNADEIQDLVQETFLRAFKYVDQFFHNPRIIPWLFVIMKNIYINHYRNRQQQLKYETQALAAGQERSRQELFTENTVENTLTLKDIQKALAEFPAEYYTLFTQYLNGYKYKELSVMHHIPEGTIKSRIHLIRKDLQKKFAAYR